MTTFYTWFDYRLYALDNTILNPYGNFVGEYNYSSAPKNLSFQFKINCTSYDLILHRLYIMIIC
jgi:hypothetical protein